MKEYLAAILFVAGMSASAAFAQYKTESAGAPPSELSPAYAPLLQDGIKITGPGGNELCEIWLRKALPSGPKSSETAVAFPTIPQGALLGVIRFTGNGADRRGQTIKPGVYTLRYSLYPVNGDHQGVAPQRDFALLTPAADDKDPNATPNYDTLVDWSRKASGTPHPAVLEIGPSSATGFPSFTASGDRDWVLNAKVGNTPMAIVLVGKAEG